MNFTFSLHFIFFFSLKWSLYIIKFSIRFDDKLMWKTFIIWFVVTQFWIHQDFLKCYVISIIIYKNPKKIKKKFKNAKIYFSRVNRIFPSKPNLPGQYRSNHVDQGKKWVSGRFGSKPLFLTKTEFTRSIRVKPCRPG